jgi:hypothetical protein
MRAPSHTSKPSIVTVGDSISELCRWPDHATVKFRCPLRQQELRFSRIEGRSNGTIDIELEPLPESAPVVAA